MGVEVNICGVRSVEYLEVVEIEGDSKPYPTLLGLDWEYNNQEIIDLKKRQMIFKVGYLKVTTPLDPTEGQNYVEPSRGGFESGGLENVYKFTLRMEYYVDPTKDGEIIWCFFSSCASNSGEEIENWKQ
jgi:hypothetical protein